MNILGILGLGSATEKLSSKRSTEQAFVRCLQAAKLISSSVKENSEKNTIVFIFKYGLQNVQTTVNITSKEKTCPYGKYV